MRGMLLVGMADQEAAAVEIMTGMYWPDRRCVTLARTQSLSIPRQSIQAHACDVCVVDLPGLDMRKYSEMHGQRLLEFLAGRQALLLVWGADSGWTERLLPLAAGQRVRCLSMPYSSHAMRQAISKLLESAAASPDAGPQPPLPAPKAAPAVLPVAGSMSTPSKPALAEPLPAWRRAEELAQRLQAAKDRAATEATAAVRAPLAVSGPAKRSPLVVSTGAKSRADRQHGEPIQHAFPAVQPVADAVGLGRGAMEALLAMFPSLRAVPLVALGTKILIHQGPQLIRIGWDLEFALNFRQGWIASGLSLPVLQRLARNVHLVDAAQVVPWSQDDAENLARGWVERAQMALDEVAWHLLSDAIKDHTLVATGDMRIQLRRFPNVTALSDVGPLDVQLAAICARAPHHVSGLLRAFPQDQQAVLRFVVLATASGLISVLADDAQAQKVAAVADRSDQAVVPEPRVRAKPGFLKSFLDKLF